MYIRGLVPSKMEKKNTYEQINNCSATHFLVIFSCFERCAPTYIFSLVMLESGQIAPLLISAQQAAFTVQAESC